MTARSHSAADLPISENVWVLWVLGGLIAWSVVAVLFAVLVGRGIRIADERSPATGVGTLAALAPTHTAVRARRRTIPLPPIGIALVMLAVVLEATGFLLRLKGATGTAAHVLSMDAPLSLPRMYVTALFGAAALMAVAGAGVIPGRRTWWTAVGLVAAGIASVKAGATVHARAVHWLSDSLGSVAALTVCALLAIAVLSALWFLSRTERRDRRRVLGSLLCYAVAAVGLSGVSQYAGGAFGSASSWAAGATFIEESGEALAGVAFLIAVLAGVAPRVVLPAGWPLRRAADAYTLDAPQAAVSERPTVS